MEIKLDNCLDNTSQSRSVFWLEFAGLFRQQSFVAEQTDSVFL